MGVVETFFSSIISGGVTGLLGVAVQRFCDYKNKQLDIEVAKERMSHELLLRKADAEILEKEYAARVSVADIEADSKAFSASFNEPIRFSEKVKYTESQGWLMVILDFIRGIVRPGLTVYLCILTTLIYMETREYTGQNINEEKAFELMEMIVGTVLYLTTTCLLWWFGVRNKQLGYKLK